MNKKTIREIIKSEILSILKEEKIIEKFRSMDLAAAQLNLWIKDIENKDIITKVENVEELQDLLSEMKQNLNKFLQSYGRFKLLYDLANDLNIKN